MWRELIYSTVGHTLVFSGLIFPSFFLGGKAQPPMEVIAVRAVSPQSIEQLLKRSAPPGKPKPRIPQVDIKPDRKLPRKTSRPKQAAKQKTAQSEERTTGSETGEKSNKSPVEGIKVDSVFEYPEYLIEMRDRIQNNWRPPTLNKSLVTRVYFNLGRDGKILRSFVEKRTGEIAFDMLAMNAVTKSAPFPPLPEEFPGKELGVHFDFIYENK